MAKNRKNQLNDFILIKINYWFKVCWLVAFCVCFEPGFENRKLSRSNWWQTCLGGWNSDLSIRLLVRVQIASTISRRSEVRGAPYKALDWRRSVSFYPLCTLGSCEIVLYLNRSIKQRCAWNTALSFQFWNCLTIQNWCVANERHGQKRSIPFHGHAVGIVVLRLLCDDQG